MTRKLKISFYNSIESYPFRGFEAFAKTTLDQCYTRIGQLPVHPTHDMGENPEIEVCVVDHQRMEALNRSHRSQINSTDILSFAQDAHLDLPFIGSLVLCPTTIDRMWEDEIGVVSLKTVYQRLMIHGFAHLLGFDHERQFKAKKMAQAEIFFMLELGVTWPQKVTY